ncbi:restriction endonuclease subunit S [uncultured Alteromonas sp.]|uniref:restriction endonuclease subunit S n=1 Tax=uncultured Alteromonas sp. TaxID=179113 RepID=UPI0030EBE18A|tara:strand:+ start:12102 stop:13298 length:1197 start_codon:yes stop_codon:yes gene_type:complete
MTDVTELGKIPDDWTSLPLGDVCKLINGRGFKPYEWVTEGFPIIRIQNLNGSDDFNYFDGHYDPKIEIENGQLLFAWSGSRGTSFGPHIWKGQKALLNYHTWKVVITAKNLAPDYFYFALKALTKIIEESAHGASALVHTQMGEMKKFILPIPNFIKEQTAIANALSDVDALIAELEKLITKKQAIKTATMQQLLTGRTRLPEFANHPDGTPKGYKQTELGEIPEDWEVKPLSELCDLKSGLGITSESIDNSSKYRCYGGNGLRGYTNTFTHEGEYVLIGRQGALCGNIQHVSGKFFASEHALVSTPKNIVSAYWLAVYLERMNLNQYSESSAQPGLSAEKLKILKLIVPTTEEQTAIANTLSDMDEEIQSLQQRLDKTRQIKQGMIQELLTGKTRLV